MRPAVITAVLLLVCVQDTMTQGRRGIPRGLFKARSCGDGWSRIDENHCAQLIGSQKTFSDAQEHCRTLNSDLVSVHSYTELFKLLLLSWDTNFYDQTFWIGAQRSGGEFRNTDGSEFDYNFWYPSQPDNSDGREDCIESNFKVYGRWFDVRCSEVNFFACAKKM